jgi:mannose-6-phosphate isomerase
VASVVSARNPGREDVKNEGLSRVITGENEDILLKDLIAANPAAFLGQKQVEKYGNSTAVLVKLLDSAERLTIQVHPDRKAATEIFKSPFGKTEAWYILDKRTINGEAPYVLLGFKPGVTRQKWEQLFYKQDIPGMLDCLHKFEVEPGQVYLIEGGIPHAIGPGCFLMEIQEPTDYSLRVEKKTPAGFEIPDQLCHQGAGFDRMFDCFHYDTYDREQVIEKWCLKSRAIKNNRLLEKELIGDSIPYFSMKSYQTDKESTFTKQGSFVVLIAEGGAGEVAWEGGSLTFVKSDQVFVPASVGTITIKPAGSLPLKLLACYPPHT